MRTAYDQETTSRNGKRKTVTFWTSATEEEKADLDDLTVYMDDTIREELHLHASPWDGLPRRRSEPRASTPERCGAARAR
jgi:hypothetical protein